MRIRHVKNKSELEKTADEYITSGYEVLSRGEETLQLRKNQGFGSASGHFVVFLFLGWWTLGLANLGYALYKRYSGERVLVKIE